MLGTLQKYFRANAFISHFQRENKAYRVICTQQLCNVFTKNFILWRDSNPGLRGYGHYFRRKNCRFLKKTLMITLPA
jgi:hypothetical protein